MAPYKLGDGSLTIEDNAVVLTFYKKLAEQTKRDASPQSIAIDKITIVELKKPTDTDNGYLRFVKDTPSNGEFNPETDLNTLTLTNDEQYKNVLEGMVSGLRSIQADVMGPRLKWALGIWIIALTTVALGHLPWAWTIAERLKTSPRIRVHWLGLAFSPQSPSILVLMVILTAVIGSCATLALTFSQRAGHDTLQQKWVWWYFTRPFTAAGIGVLAYALLGAGFISMTSSAGKADTLTSGLLAAAAVGGLAGLFTDQLLQKMRTALGLSDFKTPTKADASSTPPKDQHSA